MMNKNDDETAGTVTIRRSWGDWRTLQVPINALSGFHFTDLAGGTSARMPRNVLAAYMLCSDIPSGAFFGHSCMHGPPPHRIKVLIFKTHNDPRTYRSLADCLQYGT